MLCRAAVRFFFGRRLHWPATHISLLLLHARGLGLLDSPLARYKR